MCHQLNACISMPEIDTIRIATGYWDLPGTALLVDSLERFLENENTSIKLLIGEDPAVRIYQQQNPKYATASTFPKDYIRTDLMELEVKPEYQRAVAFLQKYCTGSNPRLEIHNFTNKLPKDKQMLGEGNYAMDDTPKCMNEEEDQSRFFHSKCYIFTGKDDACAIVGSSNWTKKGLEGNSELNYLENDYCRVASTSADSATQKSFVRWFNEKWLCSEDWTKEFLEEVLKGTPNAKPVIELPPIAKPTITKPPVAQLRDLTPYELYIKLLQIKFGNLVDKKLGEQIESYLPSHYDVFNYQIDAVKQCFSTMKEHGGFMLADVVGLGKTIVGTLLIKHFLQFPDEDGREQKVLIITPPAIRSAWKDTIDEFDKTSDFKIAPFIEFITTGSIGKLTEEDEEDDGVGAHDSGEFEEELKNANYGLIMIDESHKFRNSGTNMYTALDELIASIGEEVGVYPYVGLLSATPQNNRPTDLQNQIYLFERNHNNSTLKKAKGGNIESFFSEAKDEYDAIIGHKAGSMYEKMTPEERNKELKALSARIRECVLEDIMVRRTRTDVKKYYSQDLDSHSIVFPDIKGPVSLEYTMSHELSHLFADSMSCIAPEFGSPNGLMYYRYRAIQFLKDPANKKKYDARGSRNADTLAEQLAKIMQLNLVKRLESSFTAFKQSLLNLRQYTQNMIDMWEHDSIFICPQFNVNDELDRKKKEMKRNKKVSLSDCFDDIRKRIEKLNKEGRNEQNSNMEYKRSDFDENYITFLRQDLEIISELCDRWAKNSEDPKFDEFKESLRCTLFNKEMNRPQKLVVFTEAIDTADSISKAAEANGFKVLLITAKNRDDMELTIKENFDANYKGEWKYDYDIIVTTDVLAEGINLHRANCILNYDTPWNATRLMQRIGRVNRIGSTEPNVYVYNFMPSAEGDAEIALVHKAHTKLQSFHTLFGEDSQVFSDAEEVMHYELKSLGNDVESPLEKYIYELKQYKESHPQRYSLIEQFSRDVEVPVKDAEGNAYFLVRTPRMSGMFVKVNAEEEEGKVISLADGLEAFRADESAVSDSLPSNWQSYRKEAERVVLAELASARMMKGNSKKATEAKGIIIELKKSQSMSAESKKLLHAADKLVRQGNNDVIKCVKKIGEAVKARGLLIPYTQEEFDQYLSETITKVVTVAKDMYGTPQIILGTYK